MVILNDEAPTPVRAGVEDIAAPKWCDRKDHEDAPDFGQESIVNERPEAVTKVPPTYSAVARQANVDGTVVMSVLVCEHGSVADARIIRSVAMLDRSALVAISQWKFRPATRGGKIVPAWIDIPMKFTLN